MVNIPDIVGSGAVVQLLTPNATAATVQIVATGGGTARIGGSNTSSALGLPVPGGAGLFLPYQGHDRPYNLAGLSAYVPVGLTLSVIYEPFN